MDSILLIILLIIAIIYIYFRRKKARLLKEQGKAPWGKTYFGLTKGTIIFLVLFFIAIIFFGLVRIIAEQGYEIQAGINITQEKYLPKINNYKDFSNKEAKELSMKLYLLDKCEGGQKTIDRLRGYDSNSEIYSCIDLLRLNIKKENLPKFKTELENLKYLNTINFGKALDNYTSFIIFHDLKCLIQNYL